MGEVAASAVSRYPVDRRCEIGDTRSIMRGRVASNGKTGHGTTFLDPCDGSLRRVCRAGRARASSAGPTGREAPLSTRAMKSTSHEVDEGSPPRVVFEATGGSGDRDSARTERTEHGGLW